MPDMDSGFDELGEFLERHYEKFAIMGIFGTVTVFLGSNWPGGSTSLSARVGTVASLLIFALSALWIAVKCALLIRAAADEWPGFAEFGYAVILAGTLALSGAVLFASQVYSAATQLIGEFVFAMVVVLVLPQLYPGDLDLPTQDEPPSYAMITGFTIAFGAYFVAFVYGPTLRALTESALDLDFVLFAPLVLLFGFVFFAVRESMIGLVRVIERGAFDRLNEVYSVWKVRTSLAISVGAIALATEFTHRTARQSLGPSSNYYQVLGFPAKEFTMFHWVAIPTVFAALIFAQHRSDVFDGLIRRTGQAMALLTVLIVVLEVTIFVPNGTSVIVF